MNSNMSIVNKQYTYGKYEDELLVLMSEGDEDFKKADQLIALGADVNASNGCFDENLLSNIILEFGVYHKKGIGQKLEQIINYFLENGFDVNRDNGRYGISCLNALKWSTFDQYTIRLIKIFLNAGARNNYIDSEGEDYTPQEGFGTESSYLRLCCDDEHMSNIYEAAYQVFEAQKSGRSYRNIDWYGKAIGGSLRKVYVENSYVYDFICSINNGNILDSVVLTNTTYIVLDKRVLVIEPNLVLWSDRNLPDTKLCDISSKFGSVLGHTIEKFSFKRNDYTVDFKTTRNPVILIEMKEGGRIELSYKDNN